MQWEEIEDNGEMYESEFWNPEIGEEIEGEVLSVQKGTYGKWFLVVETEDETYITTQCVKLSRLIRATNIEVGDYVKLVYNGRITTESGFESHDYQLFVAVDDDEEDDE